MWMLYYSQPNSVCVYACLCVLASSSVLMHYAYANQTAINPPLTPPHPPREEADSDH